MLKANLDSCDLDADFLAPIGQRPCLAINGEKESGSLIPVLNPSNYPMAVKLAAMFLALFALAAPIAAIVVNTVDGVPWRWSLTHDLEKAGKIVAPAGTDRDAASTVVFPTHVLWLLATVDGPGPRQVFWATRHAMRAHGFATTFNAQTSATKRPSGSQIVASNRLLFAALAPTLPSAFAGRTGACKADYG